MYLVSDQLDLDEDAEGEGESDEDQEPGDHEEQPATSPNPGVSPGVAVIPLRVCGVTSSLSPSDYQELPSPESVGSSLLGLCDPFFIFIIFVKHPTATFS